MFRIKINYRDLRVIIIVIFASSAFLIPIWSVEFLPMADLGHHVAVAKILKDYFHSAEYQNFFVFTQWYSTNSTCYYILAFLYNFFSAETSTRLVVSIYIIGLPLSFFYLTKALGGPTWVAILSTIFIMNHNFTHGYLNFLLGMPLFFLSLGLYVKYLQSNSLKNGTFGFFVLLLLYWTHLQLYALALLAIIALIITVRNGVRVKWYGYIARVIPAVLSTTLFLVWFSRSLLQRIETYSAERSLLSIFKATYLDPRELLGQFFLEPHRVIQSKVEGYIFLALLLCMASMIVVAILLGKRINRPWSPPLAIFGTTLFCLFLCPMHYHFEWGLAIRLISIVWLTGLLIVSYELPNGKKYILLGVFISLLIVDSIWLTVGFRKFSQQVLPLKTMSHKVTAGARIYRALFVTNDQSVMYNGGVYWHVDKYMMPWRGTINEDILPRHPSCIFQYAENKILPPLNNYSFFQDPSLKYYDYVIAFEAPPDVIVKAQNSPNVEVLMTDEMWKLFRVVH